MRVSILVCFLCIGNASLVTGQDMFTDTSFTTIFDTSKVFEMPQVIVLGKSPNVLKTLPGTYSKISPLNLRQIDPLTSNEILRKVPGLNIVDEEGLGLRVNIGIRGLDPDRSRNVLILEDGLPISLNPYGEPEMYYSPSIDRMSGVEILKGSGQIRFGPQTIGGVVNFVTADPPATPTTNVRLRGGTGNFFSGFASHGNTVGNAGYIINVLHKRAEEVGPTQFELTDINAKFKLDINAKNRIGLKLGFYDEVSNSTYIGLTQTMFDAGGLDFVRMAPDDLLPIRRYSASLTHEYDMSSDIQLKTTAFGYTTTRNWRRQDFSFNENVGNQTGVVWGDPSVPNGAIYMQNSTGNRNRQFEVAGIEPVISISSPVFDRPNDLQIGVRYLFERAYEQFVIGAKSDASAGANRDNEVRTGQALSAFIQNKIEISPKFSISAGLRIENYDYEREILRGRYAINGQTQVRDTSVLAASNTFAFIPGIGIAYLAGTQTTLFGGVHRGYAPPRIKDAITSDGFAMDLDAELSTNYELGLRNTLLTGIEANLTIFFMDFENQIIPVSLSSGNLNATGLANGGRTRHGGVELGLDMDFGILFKSKHNIRLDMATTYVDSRYSADRFLGPEGTNVRGNKLPYAPEWTFWAGLNVELDFGLGFNFNSTFVGDQFTDELNTTIASANGRTGQIDSRTVFDAGIYYRVKKHNLTFRINGKNLTDARYIASRRPQGIRVGLPRFITGGIDLSF